jgi:UDP-N-acetylmuramoyl-L-alanyl-D-glutamate--2,6-diaminopimelate ligase
VQKGGLFVCIKGEHSDGHDFIDDAFKNGAAAVIIEKDEKLHYDKNIIKVEDSRTALAYACANYYGRPQDQLNIIAVTGTNGKTSTTYMLKAIYEEAGYKCGLIGTITNSMTTPMPETLYPMLREFADAGCEYVFMEASSHALALGRLEGIQFKIGIFTNLTQDHMDFHKTVDNYMEAKMRLFKQSKTGLINYDDIYGRKIGQLTSDICDIKYYSAMSASADYSAKNIESKGADGIEYEFLTVGKIFRITSKIPGMFTVYNTLAAASAAYCDGISPLVIREAMLKLDGVAGRFERVKLDKDYAVFIDYAHTPDALENTLKALRDVKRSGGAKWNGRLTVLFGCGGDRDPIKRPMMGRIASKYTDFVIVTSDNTRTENPQKIIADILKGIDKELPYTTIENRTEAIKYAIKTANSGDIILLAGKGHENYEIDAEGKHPYNEKEIVYKFAAEE